ncbi:purple acid phosphatase family protein [Confluentibacter citreus]|uniref:purple acid phosphatase family protein n=1 Tax=Confluentibacter citreus TaxID=2007307 RepID=UPI000C28BF53|nr:metallophosphoesterase family protein [Confluentibacter citreus]
MKIQSKFILVFCCLLSLYSCKKEKPSQSDDIKLQVMHPRVIWTEKPSEHAIISWTSTLLGKDNYVLYDTVANLNNDSAFKLNSSKDGKIFMRKMDYDEGVPEAFYHHAELNNLKPSTTYYFKNCTDNSCSEIYNFITAPDKEQPYAFISGGDSRLGGEKPRFAGRTPLVERKKINKMIAKMTEEDASIMAFAHGGDYCTTADWRHLYYWFEDHALTITKDNRILPLIITRGNHEHEIGFLENFWLGEISNEYSDGYFFMTQITPSSALITLNTETSMAGDQLEFLEEVLEGHRAKNNWMFVQYHKPAYPAVKDYDSEDFYHVRKYWVPLFEKYKISLALESDGHALKKTMPILNGKVDKNGIIYVGEGGLGVPQRDPDPSRWYFGKESIVESKHHLWKVSVYDSIANVTAFGIEQDTLHTFNIHAKPFLVESIDN